MRYINFTVHVLYCKQQSSLQLYSKVIS